MRTTSKRGLAGALALSALLALPQGVVADAVRDEEPSALAMVGDAVVARPLGLLLTVVGAATYVVTLPFSLAGGNAKAAGKTLVAGPAMATFVRCLGCAQVGYNTSSPAAE